MTKVTRRLSQIKKLSKVNSFIHNIGLKTWIIRVKVVIIGSGATAITLVPAMSKGGAGHVTMLQRSPTYIASVPSIDFIYEKLVDLCLKKQPINLRVLVILVCNEQFMHCLKSILKQFVVYS